MINIHSKTLAFLALALLGAGISLTALGAPAGAKPPPLKSASASASSSGTASPTASASTSAKPVDPRMAEAQKLFSQGVEAHNQAQWAEALSAFEQAYAIVQNAIISYNIGYCERALGHYVRAQRAFKRALAENDSKGGTVLSPEIKSDTEGFLQEAEQLVVKATVKIRPLEAAIVVDGRPIGKTPDPNVFAASLEPPGPGAPAPAETFTLLLDPGNHVFILSLKGFKDAVSNQTLRPGEALELNFELDKLPATIRISSDVEGAVVRVGPVDVGPVPVDVKRAAGTYPVVVQKEGYVPYETTLTVQAGEEAKIEAVLPKAKLNVAEQWWFWTAIVGALGTAAVVTYFAVRPEPEPPPFDGGNTGWVVGQNAPSMFRF